MSKKPYDFIKQFNGKVIDDDGAYGAQCVDGFRVFNRWIGYPVRPTETGFADGYFTKRETNGYLKHYDVITNKKKLNRGDWLFWKYGSKSCPMSHVGMFVDYVDDTKTSAHIFGENQGGNGGFRTVVIPLDILGAFRPKLWSSGWKKNSIGWWWRNDDGSYPKNEWKKINGEWYFFDTKGYIVTGWLNDKGSIYYLKNNGAIATGDVNGLKGSFTKSGALKYTKGR